MSYLSVSKHSSAIKHRILLYYLRGCVLQAKLHNWGYIETHGGSGICTDKTTGELIDGSPLIVHASFPEIPMNLCEIDVERFEVLAKIFQDQRTVNVFEGDCNRLIDKLHEMPDAVWYFHFVDPDGVRTEKNSPITDQLSSETLQKIVSWRNTEILLNFPLLPYFRWGAYSIRHPEENQSRVMSAALTRHYGSTEWKSFYSREAKSWNPQGLIGNFISNQIQPHYKQKVIEHLVRTERNTPVYYLVFGTNHRLGLHFMSKAFKKADEVWSTQLSWAPGQVGLLDFCKEVA